MTESQREGLQCVLSAWLGSIPSDEWRGTLSRLAEVLATVADDLAASPALVPSPLRPARARGRLRDAMPPGWLLADGADVSRISISKGVLK